ncbi:MAG: PP2C family protein-serine/threonine phosphatase [Fimbriiglobus sp.]
MKRSHNQDACAAQPAGDNKHWVQHGHVFIVADGMGGHAVGEKASAKAVRDIPMTFIKHVVQEGVMSAIRRAFKEANESIHQIGVNNPEFKGLGTTGTALFIRPDGAWLGHVGDSRAYRVRGNRIQQLTFDHSWVWEVARRQGIDPDELGDFKRNVIIRSLGPDAEVEADIEGPHPLEPGDSFLMCSDGLTNEVLPQEIGAIVSLFPPEVACQHLIDLANIRGGRDNITCLIVQIPKGVTGLDAAKGAFLQKARRTAKAIDRVLPWPFVALACGAVTAAISVVLQSEGLRFFAVPAFAIAAILIFSGLVGLYRHLRKKSEEAVTGPDPSDLPTELHLYRDYAFEYDRELLDRFLALDAGLRAAIDERPHLKANIDWDTHAKFSAEAEKFIQTEDWINAFANRFQAAIQLAQAYNQNRGKGEEFKPSWEKN